MSGGPQLSTQEEAKIIALVIRGDTIAQIQQALATPERPAVSHNTIAAVKLRNADTLTRLRQKVMNKEMADIAKIKNKANNIIDTKLNTMQQNEEVLAKAAQDYVDGIITVAEYKELKRMLKAPTMQELVVVSKEMHAQSTDAPAAGVTPEDATAITQALEAGDEVKLTQLVFKKGGTVEGNAQR